MAWAERTIHEVSDPPSDGAKDEEDRINKILKNMPPFIKLSSRRARKTLAKYEEVKQRHIENLRNNAVFKFVMMVAGFTNENMQKYWKGSEISPFQEGYGPKDVKIDKEEIDLLVARAREKAFADLHQFCRPIVAIPMYRRGILGTGDPVFNEFPGGMNRSPRARNRSTKQGNGNLEPREIFPLDTNSPVNVSQGTDSASDEAVFEVSELPEDSLNSSDQQYAQTLSPTVNEENLGKSGAFTSENDVPFDKGVPEENRQAGDKRSRKKYIYNMSDMEFKSFCRFFVNEGLSRERVFNAGGDNKIERYVLGDHDANPKDPNFPADKHQRANNNQTQRNTPQDESSNDGNENNIREGQGRDRVFDEARIFDENWRHVDSYDHRDPFVSVERSNWKTWSNAQPIVQWGDNFSQFWFQRYIARWLVMDEGSNSSEDNNDNYRTHRDLKDFQNKYGILFNNLFLKTPERKEWMRDLTGLRLTKMIRGERHNNRGNSIGQSEEFEGQQDMSYPCESPCEVPLDFVRPLFNERFAYWKHELVLGEYEKRTMYEADQWLQKTPWAIGKIYLQPNIYSHMQEAHIAISSKFKKFSGLSLQDWLTSEKHMFFYAKLVALCIRTSAVLSNKKYGLDKAYMRLNLEKRRIMYSLGKMEKPQRMPVARLFPRASVNQERLWEEYRAARARGDVAGAQSALQGLN